MTHFEVAIAIFERLGLEIRVSPAKMIDVIDNEGKKYEFSFGLDGSFSWSRNISQQEEEEQDGYFRGQ